MTKAIYLDHDPENSSLSRRRASNAASHMADQNSVAIAGRRFPMVRVEDPFLGPSR